MLLIQWLATEVDVRLIPPMPDVLGPLLRNAWREGLAWGLLVGFIAGLLVARIAARARQ